MHPRRRLTDQILVLEAIVAVRKELREAEGRLEQNEVMLRLTSLYVLLNAEQLIKAATESNNRYRKKVA